MKLLFLAMILLVAACGGGKKKETTTESISTQTNLVDPRTLQPTVKDSKILSKLRNSEWHLPSYPVAGITFGKDDKVTVVMSETSFISNANVAVLEEESDFVVFNLYIQNTNTVFGLTMPDSETVKISVISASNSIEGYRELHESIGAPMKRKS